MIDEARLNDIRGKALDRIEQWEFISNGFFWAGAVFELGLGVTFLLMLDFSNPLHVLLLLAVATVYVPLVMFLFSLSSQLDRQTARILKALDVRDGQAADAPSDGTNQT